MNKKHKNLIAATAGFLVGSGISIFIAKKIKENNADQILKTVKETLSAQGTVSNAWINSERISGEHYGTRTIYNGGANITSDQGETKSIDFIADADTGELFKLEVVD